MYARAAPAQAIYSTGKVGRPGSLSQRPILLFCSYKVSSQPSCAIGQGGVEGIGALTSEDAQGEGGRKVHRCTANLARL